MHAIFNVSSEAVDLVWRSAVQTAVSCLLFFVVEKVREVVARRPRPTEGD
jgi:hypothetical protein